MLGTCKHCGKGICLVNLAWGLTWMHENELGMGTHEACVGVYPRSVAEPVVAEV